MADVNGWFGMPDLDKILAILTPHYHGVVIANGGLSVDIAKSLVAEDTVPLVAFGRYFIANPDLVARVRADAPFNPLRDRDIYGRAEEGYADYPFLVHEQDVIVDDFAGAYGQQISMIS